MNGILTEREKNIVSATKEELEKCRSILESTPEARKTLVPAYENVLRELRGFDSELFIVSSMGMLKSGKSSLVNLLARSELASPTGYGTDTTLRPALIMPATAQKPEGEIEVWFASNPTELSLSGDMSKEDIEAKRKEMLSSVFDFVRGVGREPENAVRKSHRLTEEKLKNILCKKQSLGNELPSEPILVIVRVPRKDGSLLSDKIVLLDTPGLDSMNSEWTTNSAWYLWLMEKSDLLLFLQSSVAPLNLSAGEILKELQRQKRGRPIWLIQNLMEAKHWMKKDVQEAENLSQKERAVTEFQKISTNTNSYSVNLGKDFPKLFEQESDLDCSADSEHLLNESGFKELEEGIKDSLKRNATAQRKGNCIRNVENAKNEFGKMIKSFRENEVGKIRNECDQKRKVIENAFKVLAEKIDPNLTPAGLRVQRVTDDQISFKGESESEFWGGSFDASLNSKFKSNENYNLVYLNNFKDEKIREAHDRFRQFLEETESDDVNWESEEGAKMNLRRKVIGQFSKFIKEVMAETQDAKNVLKCEDIQHKECPQKMNITEIHSLSKIEFPDYDSSGLSDKGFIKRLSKKCSSLFCGGKIYIGERCRSKITDYKYNEKSLKATLKFFHETEQKKIKSKIANWANEQFNESCRDFLKKLEARREECLEEIRRKRENADSLESNLFCIESILENAMKRFDGINN
ncbi:MAG: dynamin family protein [Opitutales bacterium]|nr:dynamin family protein [Opitutales bacterium]